MSFHMLNPTELNENVFSLIQADWFLMTAEKEGHLNAMTVSWASLGVLWTRPVVVAAVRPERYTREFLDAAGTFSMTIFSKEYRKMLVYFGTVSGRQEDKIAKQHLTVLHKNNIPYFEEARLAFFCTTLCRTQLSESDFLTDKTFINKWYGGENKPNGEGGGYHYLYIGEINEILENNRQTDLTSSSA